ncbi:hypothetical protein [Burkholderia sp. Ac-20344]|uniref:hypothetical protein n=1 Tax=Burkholderia sp. Ac-20344 TaxID=2703890 RepID=UPI00197B1066|nr:hypothetical protein [Burkholderia sp. Ac-20344]MBN3836077.1 hypothetical protein [Burkholderia sp. Ac-20344]
MDFATDSTESKPQRVISRTMVDRDELGIVEGRDAVGPDHVCSKEGQSGAKPVPLGWRNHQVFIVVGFIGQIDVANQVALVIQGLVKALSVVPVDGEVSLRKKLSFFAEDPQFYFIVRPILIIPAGAAHLESIWNSVHVFYAAIQRFRAIVEIASPIGRSTEMNEQACTDIKNDG